MCIDYKALNKRTLKNRYSISHIDELMEELRGAKYFTKIDLHFRYHPIRLRRYVLVFFDDILIYSKTWKEHLQHMEKVLHILEEQRLYPKMSKCEFGLTEMLYLGHVIGEDGVRVHQEKIKVILDWATPRNMTELQGFLGICTYYRRFMRGFSQRAAPLTDLTKKGAFVCMNVAQEAFERLKRVMSSCPVLALLDFSQLFVLECDTSG
eukprot:PITA_36058